MNAEKLVADIVQVLGDGGWTPNTYVKNKAVALLTHAIEEETRDLRAQVAKLREKAQVCITTYPYDALECGRMHDGIPCESCQAILDLIAVLARVESGTKTSDPCAKCSRNKKDCDPCGPPAWESFCPKEADPPAMDTP